MEVTVKRIYRQYGDADQAQQWEMALVFAGRKFANCVVVDFPIRVHTMELRDAEKAETPQFKGKPYPAKRMADSLITLAKTKGITIAAERLVRAYLDGTHLEPDAIDAKPSENGASNSGIIPGSETPAAKPEKKAKKKAAAADDKPAKEKGKGGEAERGNLVKTISAKFKLDPKDARKILRKAGLNAPYTDEAKITAALEKHNGATKSK